MSETYAHTRARLETYFDRTAAAAWARLTSDAPVSRIRQTVREGRDQMRATLLSRLPEDLTGARVLDAGCGAGQMAIELAERGAKVTAVDISPKLLDVARERTPETLRPAIDFVAGDMLDPAHGGFDYVVAMDSLIHYRPADIASVLARLSERTQQSIVFTVAPRTPLLTAMHTAGKAFPRGDRSPAIAPISTGRLSRELIKTRAVDWRLSNVLRVARGFYISQAMELSREVRG
ncbi:MAG: magnesium protoporphyrin IX methyltransferase [Pseudomonadota bacterium]